jgi:predicted HD phosphohydrolase
MSTQSASETITSARGGRATNFAAEAGPASVPARWLHETMGRSLDPLWSLLVERGSGVPGGELSLLDHALRSATLAHDANADDETVIACLLHNVGHLIHAELAPRQGAEQRDRHHVFGAGFVSLWFGPGVTEPIRLHVAAKRYLCAVESGYRRRLSPRAKRSLMAQGGPFDREEAAVFLSSHHAARAVELRRHADLAHRCAPDLRTLRFFRSIAERRLALPSGGR